MVGHIVESDSDVQCYLQKVSCGSVGLPRQWSQYVICQGIQLVVVHIRITQSLRQLRLCVLVLSRLVAPEAQSM